jgi:hypothetical protein
VLQLIVAVARAKAHCWVNNTLLPASCRPPANEGFRLTTPAHQQRTTANSQLPNCFFLLFRVLSRFFAIIFFGGGGLPVNAVHSLITFHLPISLCLGCFCSNLFQRLLRTQLGRLGHIIIVPIVPMGAQVLGPPSNQRSFCSRYLDQKQCPANFRIDTMKHNNSAGGEEPLGGCYLAGDCEHPCH